MPSLSQSPFLPKGAQREGVRAGEGTREGRLWRGVSRQARSPDLSHLHGPPLPLTLRPQPLRRPPCPGQARGGRPLPHGTAQASIPRRQTPDLPPPCPLWSWSGGDRLVMASATLEGFLLKSLLSRDNEPNRFRQICALHVHPGPGRRQVLTQLQRDPRPGHLTTSGDMPSHSRWRQGSQRGFGGSSCPGSHRE